MKKTTAYARKRAHQGAFDRKRHEVINPVTEAVIRSRIEEDIQRLRTAVGLQAYIGEDAAGLAELGFEPCATVKAAKHYPAADMPAICQALIARLQYVMAEA